MIKNGFARKAVQSPSRWAEKYRVVPGGSFPGPWKFTYHPWLKGMHDSVAEMNVGKKAAQMGYTEMLLNVVFYNIDIRRWDCLYLLPAQQPDATDFTASRFNPALEASPHLKTLFSEVENLGHKRAGGTNLYIRGTRSKSQLKSIPVNFIAFDEVDEMEQSNIPLAFERSSGQTQKQNWMISTPTIDGYGIDKYYQYTTQEHFFFKCPSCSKFIELTFPESIVITTDNPLDPELERSHYICTECKNTLHHEDKITFLKDAEWVPTLNIHTKDSRGFHIPQMYSSAKAGSAKDMAAAYLRSLRDPTEETEFYNSKLGKTHIVDSARIDDKMIDDCIKSAKRLQVYQGNKIITMGVDVGKALNVEIAQWDLNNTFESADPNVNSRPTVIWYGKLYDFIELDRKMVDFNVRYCVIDANPERRKAYEFAMRFYGRVKMCFYGNRIEGKTLKASKEVEHAISVDRSTWLDLSLGRFKTNTITLPFDLDEEYRNQIKALVRIYEKDAQGNPVGKYVNGSSADHYAHSRNYCEIALPLAFGISQPQDIKGVY